MNKEFRADIRDMDHDKGVGVHIFIIFAFVFALLGIGIYAILSPKQEISLIEKRALAKLPEFSIEAIFSGAYTRELSVYFADNFPFRESLVALSAEVEELYGVRTDDIRLHQNIPPPQTGSPPPPVDTQPSTTTSSTENSSTPAIPEETEEEGNMVGGIFVYKGQGLQIFGGSPAVGQRYASTINKYQELMGADVQIYNLIIPSAIEFALPEKYKDMTRPEKPAIDAVYSALSGKVKTVNAYDNMKRHSSEYIYFNTDHHWTSLGAYYAYQEFAKVAGFTPTDIKQMEKRELPNFLGSLYGQTQDSKLKENIDSVAYYMIDTPHKMYHYYSYAPYNPVPMTLYGEYAKPENSYSVFLHGDFPMIRIDTEIKNGRKIAVLKESYGNAFIPFLVNHYEQVLVIDPRYFEIGFLNIAKQYGINEVLFINNNFAAHTSSYVNLLNSILYPKPKPPPVVEEEIPVQETIPEYIMPEGTGDAGDADIVQEDVVNEEDVLQYQPEDEE